MLGLSIRLAAGGALAAVSLAACGSTSTHASGTFPATSTITTVSPSSSSAPSSTSSSPSTTAGSSGAGFDSCSVVTQAEAASALGQSVSPGVLGNATVEGGRACVFYAPEVPQALRDPNIAVGQSVRVVVVEGSQAVTFYNDYKSKVNAQPVSGYGDQAFFDGYASLSVLKGTSYLRVAVSGTQPNPLPSEEQLASAILPNI